MKFVSRAELGWDPSPADSLKEAAGVKVHYLGSKVDREKVAEHSGCLTLWRNIRDSHLANKAEKYVDVAYNFAVCRHGYVLEGRGLRKQTGANGNPTLNARHYAVVALVGDEGDVNPTTEMLFALREIIEELRRNGAGPEIKGHRDGYATSCPGEPLYKWVQAGAPWPGQTPKPAPSVPPGAPRFPGRLMRVMSPMMRGDDIRDWQQQMRRRGWRINVDGWYGPASASVARQFQAEKGLGQDGVVGPATWAAAFTLPVT